MKDCAAGLSIGERGRGVGWKAQKRETAKGETTRVWAGSV